MVRSMFTGTTVIDVLIIISVVCGFTIGILYGMKVHKDTAEIDRRLKRVEKKCFSS